MADLTIVGIALLGFSIIGGCYLLGNLMQARAIADRDRIEARFEKQYADKCREADRWRMAFEEVRIENSQMRARLKIQNQIYGKAKVKDLK